jgi:hypothetical protein
MRTLADIEQEGRELAERFLRIAERCEREQDPRKPLSSWIKRMRARNCRRYAEQIQFQLDDYRSAATPGPWGRRL